MKHRGDGVQGDQLGGRRGAALAAVVLGAVATMVAAPPAHAVTVTFTFRDTLAPREGGASLVPVYNGAGAPTILVEGMAGFVPGRFVTQTITMRACPTAPTVRAWSFPARGGFRFPNTSPVVATGSYTISMLLRFDPLTGGYARLVDFSNSMLDTGIYSLGGGVSFYPVGTYAPGSFVTAQDTFVTLTREASTRVVNLYINGAPAGTYTDTTNLYAPAASALYFFMDNTTGSAAITEANAGVVSFLQVADAPSTAAQVAASLADICATVRCGDGILSPGEGCDSGSAAGSTSCDQACRIRDGNPCNTAAPGALGDASCASGRCFTSGLPAPGRCGQCATSAQCSGATPTCDAARNTCVACTAAGAGPCPAGTVCATAGARSGQCVACVTDAQCGGATPACDPASGRCVVCTVGNASGCAGATPVCDPVTTTCAACTAPGASACPAPSRCAVAGANVGRCVACTASAHCTEAAPLCDAATNRCVACTTPGAGACPAGTVCAPTGQCVGCLENSQCAGTTPVCDTRTRSCVRCDTGGGSCTAPRVCDGTTGACVECITDATCAGATPLCDPSRRRCVACAELGPGACGAGRSCETTSGRCVEAIDSGTPDGGDAAGAEGTPDGGADSTAEASTEAATEVPEGSATDAASDVAQDPTSDTAVDVADTAAETPVADSGVPQDTLSDTALDVASDLAVDAPRDSSADAADTSLGRPGDLSGGCGCRAASPRSGPRALFGALLAFALCARRLRGTPRRR